MNEIAKNHHAAQKWQTIMVQLRQLMVDAGVHPSQTVVLVPYAQLMLEARAAWCLANANTQFLPRFETSMNWTRGLGGFEFGDDDIRQDAARDVLTAGTMLARAGLQAQQALLAPKVMEAAWSLAKVAAAVAPQERVAWGQRLAPELGQSLDSPLLALESATSQIALAWAANASYPTDRLFSAQPQLLLLLDGFQAEPIALAMCQRLGARAVVLQLDGVADAPMQTPEPPNLRPTHDGEDEAQAAAACVMAHLAHGRSPVALVALDRVLTRRVRAMLDNHGIAVKDETGWKLSTTRAAAGLMSLLRASRWDSSTDDVLDWLKNSPVFGFDAVAAAETEWRKVGLTHWCAVPADHALANLARPVLASLATARPLAGWLLAVRAALQSSGQWAGLALDEAGQAVLRVLRLAEGMQAEFDAFTATVSLGEFIAWVSQTLEAESFNPVQAAQLVQPNLLVPVQVVILPLSQLLGRTLPAVVMPGCDEVRLPVSPEPVGPWTPAQRQLLGMPSRAQLASAHRAAWQYALQFPKVDLLWRESDGSEQLMPSGFVQELLLQGAQPCATDPRLDRVITPKPSAMPAPQGHALPVRRLSSSAYEDLRRCPYRFFALRQLGLQSADELDTGLDKRDFGNWLHSLLKLFHEALNATPAHDLPGRVAMINIAANQARVDLGLSQSEFLPFAASWPRVRAGYLNWLATHEASGAVFCEAETWKETPLGEITLVGKIDRIDRLADGTPLVIDYKTESRTLSTERVKAGSQDTQLAFYAALLTEDTVAGAYVNLGEKEVTKAFDQPDLVDLRDQLIDGILSDMSRIHQGAAMPALGEGKACDFCAARGLCRKDFWSVAAQ